MELLQLFVSQCTFLPGNLENVFLSPLSIYNAVVMTMAGADGITKEEMMDTLRVPQNLRGADMHDALGGMLQKYFQPSAGVEVSLANRLFLIRNASLVEAFRQLVQKCYNADIESVWLIIDPNPLPRSPAYPVWKKSVGTSTNGCPITQREKLTN